MIRMTDNTADQAAAGFQAAEGTDRSGWLSTGASALGALAMTSCCILPLVLVSFGITGVFLGQLGALYQYKWIMFGISSVFLAYAFWKAYRPVTVEACTDGTCARPINRTLMRSILWAAAAIMALAIAFPYVSAPFLKF
jgi:mercuric ion transport protein